jgi:hypothetical protein
MEDKMTGSVEGLITRLNRVMDDIEFRGLEFNQNFKRVANLTD